MRSLATLLVMLSVMVAPIWGQPPSASAINLVGGVGLGGGTLGVAGQAYVGVGTSIGEFLVRTGGTTDFDLSQDADSSSDVAILYGFRSRPSEGLWFRAAAGPGWVHSVRRGPRHVERTQWSYRSFTESAESSAIGLAVQLDVAWGSPRALGVELLGNMSSAGSFAAVTLSVHIGSAG